MFWISRWYDTVDDWRDEIDDRHVYRWNATSEARVWHFYNKQNDTNKRNDNAFIDHYLWYIQHVVEKQLMLRPSYPDDDFDVMKNPYYIKHYGAGNAQTNFH
eukprot:206190_1